MAANIFCRNAYRASSVILALIILKTLLITMLMSDFKGNHGDFDQESKDAFMARKEADYLKRRDRIVRYCNIISAVYGTKSLHPSMKIRGEQFSYDPKHNVSYCRIAKVASSTWSSHFVDLADRPPQEVARWSQALQIYAPKLWPLPHVLPEEDNGGKTKSPTDVTGEIGPAQVGTGSVSSRATRAKTLLSHTVSIVFVRHPMARLASVYYQKFIDLGDTSWQGITNRVISLFRVHEDEDPSRVESGFVADNPTYARPSEFVQFVLQHVRGSNADSHLRPQHEECPFCLVDFTIYGRVEDMGEDTAYFARKANLTHTMDLSLHKNPSKNGGRHKEYEFWSRVPKDLIKEVFSVYRLDFEMFGYSLTGYLESIGLGDKGVTDQPPLTSDSSCR